MEYESVSILPDKMFFKTLNTSYLNEIHSLLINHYVEDTHGITRIVYAKDYLYWYLKKVPPGLIIGLCYGQKLIGIITAIIIDTLVFDKLHQMSYINFLCVHSKLRNKTFGKCLIQEMKNRLMKMKINTALFAKEERIDATKEVIIHRLYGDLLSINQNYIVPINYPKLISIGFLTDNTETHPKSNSNHLHLLSDQDISQVVPKLNKFMERYKIRPHFTEDTAYTFLMPKKNIVYTFVKKDSSNITDMVTIYKNYTFCKEENKMVHTAQLAFYFTETLTLTELIICLLEKLKAYHIDQLVFKDMADNESINITKFSTFEESHYFQVGLDQEMINHKDIIFYPF